MSFGKGLNTFRRMHHSDALTPFANGTAHIFNRINVAEDLWLCKNNVRGIHELLFIITSDPRIA